MGKLDIFKPINDSFDTFINNSNNERVVFSGSFGSGKTTFIKEYFEEKESFNTFHLFPINYSVAENTDIFRMIKFDILYYLLGKYDYKFSESEVKPIDFLPVYLNKHAYKLILPVLMLADPSLGIKGYQVMNKEIESFKDEYKSLEESTSDSDKVEDFGSSILLQEGNIYENNYLSEIIRAAFTQFKKAGKQNVLIVDDLDRLDPAHIFRLFNVFAAHFDVPRLDKESTLGNNKFGFDKIIFICDLENIKLIYKHFYGNQTDFAGYINKFYSTKVFSFDTNQNIDLILDNVLEAHKINFEYRDSEGVTKTAKITGDSRLLLKYIFSVLLQQNSITLRSLVKYTASLTLIKYKNLSYKPSAGNFPSYRLETVFILEYLILIIGDIDKLLEIMDCHLNYEESLQDEINEAFWNIMPIGFLIETHKFKRDTINVNLPANFIGINTCDLEMKLDNSRTSTLRLKSTSPFNYQVSRIFEVLKTVIITYRSLNFLE